jgi:hypothetical protein
VSAAANTIEGSAILDLLCQLGRVPKAEDNFNTGSLGERLRGFVYNTCKIRGRSHGQLGSRLDLRSRRARRQQKPP